MNILLPTIEALRRGFNTLEKQFDRHAIEEEIRVEDSGGELGKHLTAAQAFQLCLPLAHARDKDARLKFITSAGADLNSVGESTRWEFSFDLPKRRAKMNCDWFLEWDEAADDFGAAKIEGAIIPFPVPDSLFYKLEREGKILYRSLHDQWQKERDRIPDLPNQFRDTDGVMAEVIRIGHDITYDEINLSTKCEPSKQPQWAVETRSGISYVRFA